MTEPRLAISNATVRLWDGTGTLRREIGSIFVWLRDTGPTFTLPMDSPAAEFLVKEPHPVVNVTIDDGEGERRWGVVRSWEIHRTGPCEKCDHCRTPALTVKVQEWSPLTTPPQRIVAAL